MNSLSAIPEEIRQLIGSYLDKPTLSVVIQVCRSLHLSFVPLLWKQAEIRGGIDARGACNVDRRSRSLPLTPPATPTGGGKDEQTWSLSSASPLIDLTLLQARSRYIEHLTISSPIPSSYCSIVFPRLRTLILTDAFSIIGESTLHDTVRLARLNPTIECLTINNIQYSLPAPFWEAMFLYWRTPKTLIIRYSLVARASAAALWRASTRFEELEFRGIDLPRYATTTTNMVVSTSNTTDVATGLPSPPASSDDDSDDNNADKPSSSLSFFVTAFPKAKRVHLSITTRQGHPYFNPTQQLVMLQSCPQLRELVWDGTNFHIDTRLASQFISALALPRNTSPFTPPSLSTSSSCWPHLESLVLKHTTFKRTDPHRRQYLAQILRSLPNPLKSLTMAKVIWEEPYTMTAMKECGHLESLQRLSVQGCKGFSSGMVREVLMQCPALIEFTADFIFAQDVVFLQCRDRRVLDKGTGAEVIDAMRMTADWRTLGRGGVQVQPWACKGLRSLKICIYATPALDYTTATADAPSFSSCARNVLRQLATLTKLEHLDLRRNLVDDRNLLSLSLASGLDALGALTQLRTFQFDDCYRAVGGMMGEKELFWMARQWKMLEEVTGPFSGLSGTTTMMRSEEDVRKEVRAVFREHQVIYAA
ncbi:hypothetical protein EC991_002791 [Linnemannia zychae]|nr:hypothetical protein EC991_002791 [Linnemannia zychae]